MLHLKLEGTRSQPPPDTLVPVILSVGHKAKLATFTFTHWPVRYSGEASTVSTQDVLPEDQRVVVQAMYEAAFSQGFEIEVIDVAGRKDLPKELPGVPRTSKISGSCGWLRR